MRKGVLSLEEANRIKAKLEKHDFAMAFKSFEDIL